MSIVDNIAKQCVQDVVYWAPSTKDGYGTRSYVAPVAIKGRWENVKELVTANNGEEVISRARVWVLQDVEENGYLFLGAIGAVTPDPKDTDNTWRIIAFTKLPELGSTDKFSRKAHLNMSGRGTV